MSQKRNPRLVDVARVAGVSRTTVSYILNGRAEEMRIAPATQRRVREAMDELGYVPNRFARALRTKQTRTIGVVSDHVASGSFASQMLGGIGVAARGRDHVVLIGETGGDPQLETDLIQEFKERRVDGLLYVKVSTCEGLLPESLDGVRAVALNMVDTQGLVPSVVPDEFGGGRLAGQLVARTDGAVVVVGDDPTPDNTAGPDRIRGIEAEFAALGIPSPTFLACEWRVASAFTTVSQWLAGGGRAKSLICLNDRMAMGTYQALDEVGLRPGRDVDVVSFDGSELAGWLRPRLTSVAIPYREMGAAAVDLLLSDLPPADLPPADLPLADLPLADPGSAATKSIPMVVNPGDSVRLPAQRQR